MANDRRELWDYFFDMNIIEFLNTVAFYKDKNDYDIELQKKALQKHG